MVIEGNAPRPCGAGVLGGGDDTPLPNILGTTMKYFSGSSAKPGLIRNSFCSCVPPNRVGNKIALERSAFNVP